MLKMTKERTYNGEVRCIIRHKDRIPFGFICNHTYSEYGFDKDLFFSFKSILTKEKIEMEDKVSFIVEHNSTLEKFWAKDVKKIDEVEYNEENL